MSRWLIISDLQIPFEHPGALDFAKRVAADLKIPRENVLNVGDELDFYWASRFPKDPNATHTARAELREGREKIRMWSDAFPQMRIARSNHGERWAARAAEAGIPKELAPDYTRMIGAPKGWRWADRWFIKAKRPFQVIHGLGYGGMYAYRNVALNLGVSTAFGHLHSSAGIAHISVDINGYGDRWGMCTGCLVDKLAYAFKYGRDHKWKPVLSLGAVVDDGLTPLLFRMAP